VRRAHKHQLRLRGAQHQRVGVAAHSVVIPHGPMLPRLSTVGGGVKAVSARHVNAVAVLRVDNGAVNVAEGG